MAAITQFVDEKVSSENHFRAGFLLWVLCELLNKQPAEDAPDRAYMTPNAKAASLIYPLTHRWLGRRAAR